MNPYSVKKLLKQGEREETVESPLVVWGTNPRPSNDGG